MKKPIDCNLWGNVLFDMWMWASGGASWGEHLRYDLCQIDGLRLLYDPDSDSYTVRARVGPSQFGGVPGLSRISTISIPASLFRRSWKKTKALRMAHTDEKCKAIVAHLKRLYAMAVESGEEIIGDVLKIESQMESVR